MNTKCNLDKIITVENRDFFHTLSGINIFLMPVVAMLTAFLVANGVVFFFFLMIYHILGIIMLFFFSPFIKNDFALWFSVWPTVLCWWYKTRLKEKGPKAL